MAQNDYEFTCETILEDEKFRSMPPQEKSNDDDDEDDNW